MRASASGATTVVMSRPLSDHAVNSAVNHPTLQPPRHGNSKPQQTQPKKCARREFLTISVEPIRISSSNVRTEHQGHLLDSLLAIASASFRSMPFQQYGTALHRCPGYARPAACNFLRHRRLLEPEGPSIAIPPVVGLAHQHSFKLSQLYAGKYSFNPHFITRQS